MPSTTCLRGISQPCLGGAARYLLTAPQAACFSTSAVRYASPPKKGLAAPPKRGSKTLNVKKSRNSPTQAASRAPAPGERKALRKRIVLSNNNALEVSSLKDLDEASVLSSEHEGQMRGIPGDAVDALRAMEAFKTTQGWGLFRRPAVLMRRETIQLAQLLREVHESEQGAAKKTIRRVLTGPRMSGKSTLLLQGLLMAYMRGWVVVNLPDAKDIVNAHTEYAPLPGSEPIQYYQEMYTANLLSQILKANKNIFESTPVTTKPSLPFHLPAKSNLRQLAERGIANAEASWPVFVALWKELTQPGRPPIMLAIDGLSHIMRDSEYLSADVKPIHAHDLALVRHFVDHLSGKSTLPNGGAVLASTTSSNSPANPTLDFSIQAAEARQFHPENMPRWNPYKHVDERVMECLKDVDIFKIGGLSKEEARSIMEYYAESGMLRAKVDDGLVTEKWSLAGMGIIGELERASVRLTV